MRIPELLENGERVMCACGDEKCYKAIEMNWNQLVFYLDISDKEEEFSCFEFPDDVGVVRYSDKDVPKPNWQSAPELAQWWAVDPTGFAMFYEEEPIRYETVTFCGWGAKVIYGLEQGMKWMAGEIDIPLGIDWRTLKVERPK